MINFIIISLTILLAGIVLLVFAMPLSRHYNAWTTRMREKQNRSPTPEIRALNTRIFAWLLRVLGASFLIFGAVRLLVYIS